MNWRQCPLKTDGCAHRGAVHRTRQNSEGFFSGPIHQRLGVPHGKWPLTAQKESGSWLDLSVNVDTGSEIPGLPLWIDSHIIT